MEFNFKKEIANELKKLGFKRSLGGTKETSQELEIGIDKRIDLPKDTFIKWIDYAFLLSVKIKIEQNVTLVNEVKTKKLGTTHLYKSDYSFFDLEMKIFDLKGEIDYRAQNGYPVNIRHLFMTTIFYQSLSELSGKISTDIMMQINNRMSNTDERTKEIFKEIIADFKALVYSPLFENTDENFSFYDYYVYFTRYEKYDKKFCAINFNYDLIKIAIREKRYKEAFFINKINIAFWYHRVAPLKALDNLKFTDEYINSMSDDIVEEIKTLTDEMDFHEYHAKLYYDLIIKYSKDLCSNEEMQDKKKLRKHNRAIDKIYKIKLELEKDVKTWQSVSLKLLDHENEYLKWCGASFCYMMRFEMEKATEVFRYIYDNSSDFNLIVEAELSMEHPEHFK